MTELQILLVEDNEGDIELAREAFNAAGKPCKLHVVMDGEQALDFLYQRNEHSEAPRPDFVLLDLNLPRLSGHQVLEAVKHDDALRCIPFIVLSSSKARTDALAAYELHANCYVVKPSKVSDYMKVMVQTITFWAENTLLPPEKAA